MCRPGQRQLADRQDPPAGPRRRDAAAGQGEPLDAGRHDPPVDDPEPARDRALEAVADRRRRAQAGVRRATTGSSRLRTRAPSGSTSSARRRLTRRYASSEPWRSRWSAVTLV